MIEYRNVLTTITEEKKMTSRKLGRHLSNIFDHRLPHAEANMVHLSSDWQAGPEALRRAWKRHLAWINENVIGPPQATDSYTVEELEKMGMIGIYAKCESPVVEQESEESATSPTRT